MVAATIRWLSRDSAKGGECSGQLSPRGVDLRHQQGINKAPKSQIGARSELIASSPVLRCVLNFDHVCGKRRLRQERLPHGALHWTFRTISDILTTSPSSEDTHTKLVLPLI